MRILFLFLLAALSLLADTPLLRINAGGPQFVAADGTWLADKYFVSGGVYKAVLPSGSTVSEVDQNVRHGTFSYQLPLPNGKYRVVLHFMEVFGNFSSRRFNVTANGTPVITDLNVFGDAGGSFIPISKTIDVETFNLQGVELKFIPTAKSAILSSIEVYHREVKPDEWCPSPALSRLDQTTLVIGPNWSDDNPCYLNFNVLPPANRDPINAQRLTAPITVKLVPGSTMMDDVYVWATAPIWGTTITPTKIIIGTKQPTQLQCPNQDCQVVLLTNKLFPQNVAPIGTATVVDGVFAPKTNNIMDGNRQITIGPGAAMSLTVVDGVLFAQLDPVASQQFIAAQRLGASRAAMEEQKNRTLQAMWRATPPSDQKLKELGEQVSKLGDAVARLKMTAIPTTSEIDVLRQMYDTTMGNLMLGRNSSHEQLLHDQIATITMQMQDLRMQIEYTRMGQLQTMFRVDPPKVPSESCSMPHWAEDARYRYECSVEGKWKRFRIETSWMVPAKKTTKK